MILSRLASRVIPRVFPKKCLSIRHFSLPAHEVVGMPALSPTMESVSLKSPAPRLRVHMRD